MNDSLVLMAELPQAKNLLCLLNSSGSKQLLFRTILHFFNAIISFASRIPNGFLFWFQELLDLLLTSFFVVDFTTLASGKSDAISFFQFKWLHLFPQHVPMHTH